VGLEEMFYYCGGIYEKEESCTKNSIKNAAVIHFYTLVENLQNAKEISDHIPIAVEFFINN